MSTHYYAIKDAKQTGNNDDQPVKQIMKTTGYTYFGPGVYKHNFERYIRITHISRWDYDMLDAFGVEIMTPGHFARMDRLYV